MSINITLQDGGAILSDVLKLEDTGTGYAIEFFDKPGRFYPYGDVTNIEIELDIPKRTK